MLLSYTKKALGNKSPIGLKMKSNVYSLSLPLICVYIASHSPNPLAPFPAIYALCRQACDRPGKGEIDWEGAAAPSRIKCPSPDDMERIRILTFLGKDLGQGLNHALA